MSLFFFQRHTKKHKHCVNKTKAVITTSCTISMHVCLTCAGEHAFFPDLTNFSGRFCLFCGFSQTALVLKSLEGVFFQKALLALFYFVLRRFYDQLFIAKNISFLYYSPSWSSHEVHLHWRKRFVLDQRFIVQNLAEECVYLCVDKVEQST